MTDVASRRPLARILEWLWLHRAMREAVAAVPPSSERTRELERRARLAAELGRRVLEPGERLAEEDAAAVACELYRQSIFWALSLKVEAVASPVTSGSERFSETWRSVPPGELQRAAGSEESLAMLEDALLGRDFAYYAELSGGRQGSVGKALRGFAEGLLRGLDAPRTAVEEIWLQRVVRVALLGLVVIGGVVSAAVAFNRWELGRDLAVGKPWRVSSVGYPGCQSPAQQCPEGLEFFFHTREEANPWLDVDLGKSREFSTVEVVNRMDCCGERAVPLVVEVSQDGATFQEVSRHDAAFKTWRAHFKPVHARWVRVRAPRTTILHLHALRVLP